MNALQWTTLIPGLIGYFWMAWAVGFPNGRIRRLIAPRTAAAGMLGGATITLAILFFAATLTR